jgi:hypothetical protein
MISFSTSGSFKRTDRFLEAIRLGKIYDSLAKAGQDGVNALARATPKDTGDTANSWGYEVTKSSGTYTITWTNSNMAGGSPVAILIQYGHGTGTGGYVPGRDYINPALRPVFDKIANDVWKAVTSA